VLFDIDGTLMTEVNDLDRQVIALTRPSSSMCLWDDAHLPGNAERSTSQTTTALLCSRSRAA
jgi:hypothetical protein